MTQRYDLLSDAGRTLARIPRFGRLLGRMSEQRLRTIDTRAGTYWELFSYVDAKCDPDNTGLIDSGLNTSGAKLLGWVGSEADHPPSPDPKPDRNNFDTRLWQSKLALSILGAIAFEMYCHNRLLGRPPSQPIDGNLGTFKKDVCLRCTQAGAYVDELGHAIPPINLVRNDLKRVEQMNAFGLEYAVLSSTGSDFQSSGDQRRQLLFFADVSTQAFFAAYWALNWSNDEEDVQSVSHWIPDPITEQNNVYLEFWEMLLDMPEGATDCHRFQQLFSVLYDRSLQPDPTRPIRSTELMYRAWDRMEGTPAITAYQSEFANLVADGNSIALGLLHDENGKSAFIQLADPKYPRDRWDTGEFMPGDETYKELSTQKVAPFRLHCYCVTNREYELFDPRHVDHRKFTDQPDIELHPVVKVSWFDACCYARWLNGVEFEQGGSRQLYQISLPTGLQWEYACRCGETTPFTWWNRQNGHQIKSGDCNFDGNNPHPGEPTTEKGGKVYLDRTIRVDGDDASLKVQPNPWGFHQMHGNVWEWCQDWYTPGLLRVRRGGCWFDDGELCRSGDRSRDHPADRGMDLGFRLAAVLVSPSMPEPAKQGEAET